MCVGSQTLAILEDQTTKYDIVLVCSLSIDTPDGMADVDGTFEFVTGNVCPKLYSLSSLGREVNLGVETHEIQYRAKDPDNTCGRNCDPQTCTIDNPRSARRLRTTRTTRFVTRWPVVAPAAQLLVPGGLTTVNLVDAVATVQVRQGASGADVALTSGASLPYECILDDAGAGAQQS